MPRHSDLSSLTFLHPIYSPKGGIEGALVLIDGERAQLAFKPEPHLEEAFAALVEGAGFQARIEPQPAGDKGPAAHPVHALLELAGEGPHGADGGVVTSVGRVVRLNYARHGEANGVVLDNGDFVHLRPDGQRQAALGVGDRVDATGEGRALRFGRGRVIEATQVNGVSIAKGGPKPKPGPKPAPPKPPKKTAHAAR